MKFRVSTILLFLVCLVVAEAQEQTSSFSDPQKPSYLSIQVLRGNVIVEGTEGSVVSTSLGLWPADVTQEPFGGGFPQIRKGGRSRAAISMSESENKMNLKLTAGDSDETLFVKVPRTVNLKVSVRSGFDRGFFWRFEKGRLVSPLCLYFGHSIEGILLLLLQNLFSASCLA